MSLCCRQHVHPLQIERHRNQFPFGGLPPSALSRRTADIPLPRFDDPEHLIHRAFASPIQRWSPPGFRFTDHFDYRASGFMGRRRRRTFCQRQIRQASRPAAMSGVICRSTQASTLALPSSRCPPQQDFLTQLRFQLVQLPACDNALCLEALALILVPSSDICPGLTSFIVCATVSTGRQTGLPTPPRRSCENSPRVRDRDAVVLQ